MSRDVVLRLTPAQARMVNCALAYYEADDHEYDDYRQAVMDNTRSKVHAAMSDAGVSS